MSHIKNIFTRATVRGVADYLLFGNGPDDDDRNYEERMEGLRKRWPSMTLIQIRSYWFFVMNLQVRRPVSIWKSDCRQECC